MIDYKKEFYDFCVNAKSLNEEELCTISDNLKNIIIINGKKTTLLDCCDLIVDKSYTNKGVFTALITVLFYKIKHNDQDIRLHRTELSYSELKKGFSARSFDTKFITPNLKILGLPSMAESGWLTRSIEQNAPFDLTFPGKIKGDGVKACFLSIIHKIEVNNFSAEQTLKYLINKSFIKASEQIIKINKLENPEIISINQLITILTQQFNFNYGTAGGAKLPMLAFHAIYQVLLKELVKFSNSTLAEIGSYTASDRTSKTAGDLEVFYNNGDLQEAIEIKLNIPIDLNMVLIAKEKIYKHNPSRYYILSTAPILESDIDAINGVVKEIQNEHGCQLILNGVLPTLKYYLRLIINIGDFISNYTNLISLDSELKTVHKEYWKQEINKLNSI